MNAPVPLMHQILAEEFAAIGLNDQAVLESALAIAMSTPSDDWLKPATILLGPLLKRPAGELALRSMLT